MIKDLLIASMRLSLSSSVIDITAIWKPAFSYCNCGASRPNPPWRFAFVISYQAHKPGLGQGRRKNGNPACHRHAYHVVHALRCPAMAGRTVDLLQNMECLDVDKK